MLVYREPCSRQHLHVRSPTYTYTYIYLYKTCSYTGKDRKGAWPPMRAGMWKNSIRAPNFATCGFTVIQRVVSVAGGFQCGVRSSACLCSSPVTHLQPRPEPLDLPPPPILGAERARGVRGCCEGVVESRGRGFCAKECVSLHPRPKLLRRCGASVG